MNNSIGTEKSDTRRLVEASAWKTHLAETDQDSTPAFETWLAAAEDNRHAWARVQESWDLFGEQATAPEVLDLRRKALGQVRNTGRKRWSRGLLVDVWKQVAVAAGVAVVLVASLVVWNLHRPDVYRTDAGERRVFTLADGSRIQLDALSELHVKYSERARDLTLLKGQARFDVAQDVERPFSVLAAGQKVVALGTAFNVDILGNQLFVTLLEGKVIVLPPYSVEKVELTPGQQLAVSAGAEPKVVTANVQRTTAWQSGQLIFDDEPLSSVIARMNRYAAKPLTVSKPAGSLKISGVFNTGDLNGFVATVTRYLPITAQLENGAVKLDLLNAPSS